MDSAVDDLGYGFGGAPVCCLSSFNPQALPSVAIYGVDRDLSRQHGDPNDGAATQIRQRTARMNPWVRAAEARGYHPVDIGILSGATPQDVGDETVRLVAALAKSSIRPVGIGCDHVISYVQLLGISAVARPTYIYFDAHLDIGLHAGLRAGLDNGNFVHTLLARRIVDRAVNIGARAWSSWAPENAVDGLTIVRTHTSVDESKLMAVFQEIEGPVYVSLDGDVLDPVWAPDCCCPEPLGLTPAELLAMCSAIGRSLHVVGADVAEISGRSGGTSEILLRCVHALFDQHDSGGS